MRIILLHQSKYSEAEKFYLDHKWPSRNFGDCSIYLAKQNEEVVGIVRISHENDVAVLRGMQIKNNFKRTGIGSLMLEEIKMHLNKECFCIPYSHLESFYGQIGFKEIANNKAPQFLVDRMNQYLESGSDVIIMKRSLG